MDKKRRNIDYVFEAMAYLGGSGSLEEIYEAVKLLIPKSQLNSYKDNTSFNGTVSNTIETYSSDSANFNGKDNYFRHISSGVWAFQEPYMKHCNMLYKLVGDGSNVVWWNCTLPDLCLVTTKWIYFLSKDPNPKVIKGSISKASMTSYNGWMNLSFNALNGKKWEIGNVHDEYIYNRICGLIKN